MARELKIDASTYDFSAGLQVDVGRDGTIAVTQPQDHKILFFDANGKLAGSIGRNGEGPGEFRDIGNHGWYADTFWVLDVSARRTSLIAPQQKFLRNMLWPSTLKLTATDSIGLPAFLGLAPRAIVGGGRVITAILVSTTAARPSWYPADQHGQPIVLASATGVFQKLIGFMPPASGEGCSIRYLTSGGNGSIGIPLCASQLTSFSRDGRSIAMVAQQNAPGASGEFHVTEISTAGDTAFARTYRYNTIAITKHIADSTIAARIQQMTGGRVGAGAAAVDALRSAKVPATYAPVRRVVAGMDGTVWLEMQTLKPDHTWRVLTPKGEVIGEITVPANVSIAVVSRSAAWGTERDQDDLESVVRYKVGN